MAKPINTLQQPKIFLPNQQNRIGTHILLKSDNPSDKDVRVSFGSSKNNLSDKQKLDLEKRVNAARNDLKGVESVDQRHQIIVKHFTNQSGDPQSRYLVENEIIQQFVRDSKEADYTKTADLIDLHGANFLIGEFEVPYNQDLKKKSLELVTFDFHPINKKLKEDYPSNAVAVKNVRSTFGFAGEGTVAYFRENMYGTDGDVAHAKAYYFVDKFLNRIEKYSFPTLRDFVEPSSFSHFRNADQEQLLSGVSNWLSAHEYFHADETKTPLPRILRTPSHQEDSLRERNKPFGFKLKNTKTSGAFEEMRVDTQAILSTFDRRSTKRYGFKQDKVARELIIAERLIRYGVMQDPNVGFDAISSHFLMNYLGDFEASGSGEKALTMTDDFKLHLGSEATLKEAFENLAQAMLDLENDIADNVDLSTKEGMKQGRQMINEFMLSYANAHTDLNYVPSEAEIKKPNYETHPFFLKVRKSRASTIFKIKQLAGKLPSLAL